MQLSKENITRTYVNILNNQIKNYLTTCSLLRSSKIENLNRAKNNKTSHEKSKKIPGPDDLTREIYQV